MKSQTEKYVEDVLRTEPSVEDYEKIIARIGIKEIRLLHAAMGLVTEAGEFMDQIKKHIMYGVDLDEINLVEELGDSNWYEGIALDTLMFSFAEVLHRNIAKLKKRFPEKFSQEAAINRNLETERRTLENKGLVVMCIHANEVPANCPCDSDCYCKTHTCKPKLRQPYSEMDFGITHMSVKGVTTVCGESTSDVAYYTANLNDVNCKVCIKVSKVNYSKDICGNE